MIKLVYCLRRRADLSPEAFRRTWLVDHAPLVRRHAEAIGALRYVQSHAGFDELDAGLRESRGLAEPYDGITEIWWESAEAMAHAGQTEESLAAGRALLEDERRFIDLSRSSLFLTTEHAIF